MQTPYLRAVQHMAQHAGTGSYSRRFGRGFTQDTSRLWIEHCCDEDAQLQRAALARIHELVIAAIREGVQARNDLAAARTCDDALDALEARYRARKHLMAGAEAKGRAAVIQDWLPYQLADRAKVRELALRPQPKPRGRRPKAMARWAD